MVDTEKQKRPSWKKRVLFLLIVIALLLVSLEGVLQLAKHYAGKPDKKTGLFNGCDKIVIACIGDSMTFGLGAPKGQSYPDMLPAFLELEIPSIDFVAHNRGVAGSNTSEGIGKVNFYLGTRNGRQADYALIMYGVNNRWNLHDATFWGWDEKAKDENLGAYISSKFQVNKLFKIAVENVRAKKENSKSTGTTKTAYYDNLMKHGWDMYFKSFDEGLLSKWIERDLLAMTETFRSRGVEPIFVSYHYPRFPALNPLLKQVAKKTGAPFIDTERPIQYYSKRRLLYKDNFHLNGAGYKELAGRIAEGFLQLYNESQLNERLAIKPELEVCRRLKQRQQTN